jgi:WD40 repeat protein
LATEQVDKFVNIEFLQSKFKGPRDMLLDLKWSRDGTLLAAATKSGIYFCETNGTAWKVSRSSGNKIDKCVMTLCYLGNEFLAGVFDGKIYRVRGKDVGQYLDAHKSAVNCMFASSNGKGFLSGGNDGKVIVWDDALTKKRTIDLTTVRDFLITNPRVRAVSESKDGKKIVIGTRSSNIIEVEASGAMRCVNNGHFDKELWGLAVIPRSEEFITCGEDSLLAKWNLKDRRLVKSAKLPYMATTCDVSKDCRYVAVGCKNGFTLIFDVNNFTEVKQITDRKAEISVLKFSPDCKLLAVGGNDSKVRLYSTNGFKFTKLLSGNSSRVTHLDWSLDSSVVMTNSSGYEILFYDAIKGEQNTSGASAYRDEKWDNWTCVLGWPVQGIFPAYSDGTDVNTCCRTADCSMIATVDDFGKVNLYKYPSYMPKAAHSAFVGHSSHVTNVVFSANEDYAITTGGNDKAIIQWKFRNHSKLQNSEEEEDQPVDVSGFDANEFASKTNVVDKNDGQVVAPKPEESPIDLGDGFIEEDLGEGDQRMAVLPFLGEVKNSVPSNWKLPPRAGDPPAGNLKIRHAFGYRCHDAKDTCKFTADSNIIAFITAALGITMNVNTLVQDFFNVHDEDLISFDISPCKRYCATGQMPAKGKSRNIDCYVWDTITKAPLVKLSGQHRGGIRHVKFSPNSNLLLTVGMDDDNSFVVYDWQNKKILCQSKVDKSFVFDCDWQDDAAFCTITKDAIKFWSIKGGGCSSMKGSWGKETKGVLASCKYAGNVCFTGSWKGEIIPWSGGSKGKTISAHSGGVFALHYDRKTNTLFSGGKDGRVIAWTVTGSSLNMKEEVISARDVQSLGSSGILCNLGIRSLDYHPDGKLLVGSKNGCIFIKNFKATTEETRFNPIMAAHFEGEVWGLACHPSNGKFVTCGGDFSIRIFNAITRADEGMYFHSKDCRAVDWSSDGNLIVLGSSDAEILLFDERMEKDPFIIQSSFAKGGKQWIEEIKFSPDCKYVAFGAHGGASKLEVMEVVGDRLEKRYNFFVGLTSALLHLDWSTDSQSIVLNSLAYELKFVNVHGKNVMAASASKDIDWATWTCKFGFPVQGIFEGVDFSDINTVCRSNNRQVLATGDDFQKVRLLKYPCIVPKAGCKRYTAHSSHVTRVRFGCNDNMLVSIGGNDKTAIVWTTDFGGEDPSKAALLSTAASMSPGRNHSLGQAGQNDDEVDEAEILGIYEPEVVEGAQSAPGASPHQAQTGGEGQDNDLGGFQQEDMGEGDQFMAVLPWLGAIKFPPSNYDAAKWKINGTKKPNVKLTLEHVHGYRSKDKRNNIFVLASGEVAYYAASVAIVHDVSKNVQRFFNQHTDKILSMDVHPDRKTIATGENGAKPMVYVWDSETMAVRFKIKAGAILKSVDTLTFSPSGKFLLATMADDDHMLNLMSVGGASGQELSVIAKEKGGRDVILGVTWRSDAEFVAIGIKLYKVCTVSGSAIKGAKGDFGNGSNFLVSVAFIRQTGDVVCGTAVGEVQLWRGTSIAKVEKNVHKGMVDGLYAGSNW